MADDEEMAATSSAGEGGSPGAVKKKIQRKPKRRTMDAHFWGMSDSEIAAIKASLAAEAGNNDGGSDRGNKDATEGSSNSKQEEDAQGGEQQQEAEAEEMYEGQLPKEEIEERRRILHTDWRMAAFSQFAHCFPHLCIKEFSIEKLERDLEGTEPGSYVGEVISRLLYHLTKDSALAGKSPDKPWLIRLRREFLRRDPAHNSLGDGPLYVSGGDFYDDEEEEQAASNNAQTENHTPYTGAGTPNVDQSAAPPQPPPVTEDKTAQTSDNANAIKPEAGEAVEDAAMSTDEVTQPIKEEKEEDEKPAWLAEFPNSRGWEDLTLKEQIYALWSVTEWHLTNADKFRNILVKYRIEPENPFWRVEPIGYDKDYNVYWMFDDFRLWIGRQTPVRRQQLVLLEETAERLKARERARQKRIRHEQRMRMKALHDRRRERIAAKKAAEQALDQEIAAMDEMDRKKAEEAATNGRSTGKRKRATVQAPEEDEEDADFAVEEEEETNTRTSSRLSRARKAEPASAPSSRPSRRRSTRNSSFGNLAGLQADTNGEEEWQKIPPEWMRSEEEEKDEDPDFGADQQENGADSDNDSELSMLEEDNDLDTRSSKRSGRRASQRSRRTSPRKPRESRVKADSKNESELSDLSDVEGMSLDEAEDAEEEDDEKIDLNDPVGYYPDSAWEAYNSVPNFDDEDKDQPEEFVHWELLIKNLPEWLEFTEKYFPNAEDPREVALVSWVEEQVVPKVNAELERREEVRKKEEAARKAAERKAKIEREKAAAAAGTSPAPGPSAPGRTFRSSRIAQKEAKEAEERAKAYAEEQARKRDTPSQSVPPVEETPESQAQAKVVERDRRAARAKEREEAKKAREEAELLAALEESEGGPAVGQDTQIGQLADPSAAMRVDATDSVPQAATPMQSQVAAQVPPPAPAQSSGPTEPSSGPAQPEAVTEAAVAETEVYDDGAEDYFLDCSVCKKRGLNLDPNSRLVACDNCDRWEHVVCHRKADERAGRPKRDWENDPFLCEDCEGLEESVILPSAPKRERSEKQKAGAKKGAEKRKAKAAAERAKKTAANPKPKPKPAAKGIARTTAPAAAPAVLSNGSNPTSHATLNQGQGPSAIQAPSQSQRSPALQMNTQAVGNYQQISQPSRSPYQPPPPHQPSFASGPSPSLQPQSQQYPPQFQPQNQQYQAHQQGMQPQQMQQSTHSQHYLPQQPQNPHYAMQPQHAFQGGVPAYQGNFAPRNAFAGSSAPQMYGQQGAFMPNTGVQQHGPSGYQSGYANFAQQHMPQGNLAVPQQHQHQQAHLIQQPGGSGNSGQLMPAPSHQRPPPQGQ